MRGLRGPCAVLMGLTLGWFADACLEALLGRFGTERAVGRSAQCNAHVLIWVNPC